ncbi:MAG TPA: YceI family protein [Chitinophagales bacterium]|nr:YceI family protein [Chitinophagales bacterium]
MKSIKLIPVLVSVLAVVMLTSAGDDKNAGAYVCTKGKIHFFSGTAMEDIEATSNAAICVLNVNTKKVYAKIQQSSFVFKDKLMQEHFNENYMESDKYPYGVLDMVITNSDVDLTKDGVYDVTLKGTLEMHGVKQDREIPGKITVKDGGPVNGTASFVVKLADHKIKIPSIVGANIAEDLKVDVDFNFEKYNK